MSQIIEAMCYARWSQDEQQAGYAWKTTQTANEKVISIMKDIQALWEQIEYEEDIYLQGEWQTDIEVVYFGTVLGDQDENGRPTYVKQVWVMEKSLWLQLNAPFWGNNHWFAKFQDKQQGNMFLKNAQQLKKHALVSEPIWLENLIAQLIKNEKQTLVICEDNYDAIFRTFSLLPPEFKKQNLTVTIGWHTSLLRVATNFNIVFCPKDKLDQVQQDLAKYNTKILKPQKCNNPQVNAITTTMFSRQQKVQQQETVAEKQPVQVQQHTPTRVSLSSVVFAIVFIAVSWFGVSNYLQVKGYASKLETAKEELQTKDKEHAQDLQVANNKTKEAMDDNTKLRGQIKSSQEEIAKLKEEKNHYIKSLEDLKRNIEQLKKGSTKEAATETQQKNEHGKKSTKKKKEDN